MITIEIWTYDHIFNLNVRRRFYIAIRRRRYWKSCGLIWFERLGKKGR